LLSPRGISLAEHRRIGACDDALYAELTHVPCMIRFPQNTMASQRSQALVQPGDMFATLLELVGMAPGDTAGGQLGIGRSILPLVRGEATLSFDLACSRAGRHERRIETPAWGARVPADLVNKAEGEAGGETSERTELFVKPDDWSEANDIAYRCPEIAGQMRAALAAFERGCETGENGVAISRELLLGFE
jgi:arylsulfatase A-like enzyme